MLCGVARKRNERINSPSCSPTLPHTLHTLQVTTSRVCTRRCVRFVRAHIATLYDMRIVYAFVYVERTSSPYPVSIGEACCKHARRSHHLGGIIEKQHPSANINRQRADATQHQHSHIHNTTFATPRRDAQFVWVPAIE